MIQTQFFFSELDSSKKGPPLFSSGASLVAQRLKCLPGMRETRVRFLDWKDPLEKEIAIHSSNLA